MTLHVCSLCLLSKPINPSSLPVEQGPPQPPLLFVAKSPQLRAGAWCPGGTAQAIDWEDLESGTMECTQSWQLFRKEDISEWWALQRQRALAMGPFCGYCYVFLICIYFTISQLKGVGIVGQGGRGSAPDVLEDRQLNGQVDAPWQAAFGGKAHNVVVKGFANKLSQQTFVRPVRTGPTAKDLAKKRPGSVCGCVAPPAGFAVPLFLQRRWVSAASAANRQFEERGYAATCYFERQLTEFTAVRKQEQVRLSQKMELSAKGARQD